MEITRETLILRGKHQGKRSIQRIVNLCSIEPDPARGDELPKRIRRYWDLESGLHRRLDVSGGEDSNRGRNRNAILVLGILRRSTMGIYYPWRGRRNSLRHHHRPPPMTPCKNPPWKKPTADFCT